ncbi:MAG: alpha/beta fold hydrolase [Litorimonas sp.]
MQSLRTVSRRALGLLSVAIVAVTGMPSLAQAGPAPELFGQKPVAHDAAISPDGTQIAVLQNVQGQYFVNISHLDPSKSGAEPRLMSLGKEVKPEYVKWVSNDRLVVSVWQSEKLDDTPITAGFLHTVDVNEMKPRLVVRASRSGRLRQYNNVVLDWLEDDPEHIIMAFAEDGENQSYPDVRRVRVDNGRDKVVKQRTMGINSWITDASGEPRVGMGWQNKGKERRWTILDPLTEKWVDGSDFPELNPESMSVVAVTNGGDTLVLLAYRGADTLGLHRYNLKARTFGEPLYQNDDYDVGSVILSKDGNDIVGARFAGESDERVLFDRYDSTYEEALAKFAGYDVQFIDQTQDASQMLLRISSPSDPGGLLLYRRGGETLLVTEAMEGLSGKDMGEVISVRYTARDGQKIPAIVTIPQTVTGSPESLPFIILPHGGPFSRDVKRFDWLAQFFANEGYGVLQMNFRGSEGFGRSFADAGRDSWVVMQEDVEDGMRWLLEKGYADPDRSCIAGWSYGGYAALMGAATHPELYNCAIAIAALSDIPMAVRDARRYTYGRARAARTFGPLLEDKALMKANNPVDRAEDITVPVFMAHGTLDSAVDHDQFRKMKRRLERAGVDGTFMSFDDEDHYMSDQANRQSMVVGIAEFLESVNGTSPFKP